MLVVDLDRGERGIGDRRGFRRNRCDGVAVVHDLVARHDVGREVGEVACAFAACDLFMTHFREVGASHDGVDAFDLGGLSGVDLLDPRMRMRTAQHFAEQHARQREVGAKVRATGDLVDAVRTDDARANDLVVSRFAHDASPRNVCAASWTARMILS